MSRDNNNLPSYRDFIEDPENLPSVEEFKEEKRVINIRALIHVERESQKGIIIGKRGEALKRVGTEARKDIEAFFGKKVFLQIFVKLSKDWRSKDRDLSGFGYNSI